jgi:PAS domain S-box-containing protein
MKKNRKPKNETLIQIAALLIASLLLIAFFTYVKDQRQYDITIVAVGLALGFLVFLLMQYSLQSKWGRNSRSITKAIESIIKDAGIPREPSEELADVYESLDELYQSLKRRDQNRLEILNIVNSAASSIELEKLLESFMPKLVEILRSSWGCFYLANNATNKLEIKSSVGFGKNVYKEFDLTIGEGFIGMAALKREPVIVTDIPDDTVYMIKTFMGTIKPKNIMLVPIINQEQLMGVLALGSIYAYTNDDIELVNLIKYYIGAAIANSVVYERSKRLANELKFQNKLIQDLNNDLETKINERNLFLGDIMNSIKDYAIYSLDKEGIVQTWNKGAELTFGYKSNDIVGRNVSMIYPPEDVEAGIVLKRINEAIKTGRYSEEGWRKRPDGSTYYAEMSVFAIHNDAGETIGISSITKDITDLQGAKENLSYERSLKNILFDKIEKPILVINESYAVENFNEKVRKFFNISNIKGKDVTDLFGEWDVLREKPRDGGEYTLSLKTGGGPVEITVFPIGNTTKSLILINK